MYNNENLAKLKKMDGVSSQVMNAFWAFDQAAVADGAIPVKYKELIAVAVALTTQCPYCIDIHSRNARAAGATDTEIVEAAMVAAALRAGAAVTHATHAFVAGFLVAVFLVAIASLLDSKNLVCAAPIATHQDISYLRPSRTSSEFHTDASVLGQPKS